MRFGLDSVVYFAGTVFGTLALAACGNSLHRRNVNIGEQSAAAASRGVRLIIATNDLSAAGYALSVGSGGIAVTSLILFIYSLRIIPLYPFFRKIFFLSPLALLLNTLLTIASGIAVTVIGRQKSATVEAFIGSTRLPDATVRSTLAASGASLNYWGNDYVKFMVGAAWPAMLIGPIVTVFAYTAWRKERPSAHHARDEVRSPVQDKPSMTHV